MNVSMAESSISQTRVLQDYWMRNDATINGLFYINQRRCLAPNPFALGKIDHLLGLYEDLIVHSKDPLYYQKNVLSWLQLPDEEPKHLWMTNAETLIDLIRHFEGEIIPENHLEDFYKEFQLLYRVHCLGVFESSNDKLSHALGVRKGKKQRKSTINKELAILGFPYRIVKKQRGWIIERDK